MRYLYHGKEEGPKSIKLWTVAGEEGAEAGVTGNNSVKLQI